MTDEIRRYKITGFKEIDNENDIRVLMKPADAIKPKEEKQDLNEMLHDPMGVAQKMMNKQIGTMVNDTFRISKEQYYAKKYFVGDHVTVVIRKE